MRWRLLSGKLVQAFAVQPFGQFVRNGFVIEIGKGDVRVAVQTGIGEQQDLAISSVTIDDSAARTSSTATFLF